MKEDITTRIEMSVNLLARVVYCNYRRCPAIIAPKDLVFPTSLGSAYQFVSISIRTDTLNCFRIN